MSRRIPAVVAALLVLGPVTACGGDDSAQAGGSASTPPSSAATPDASTPPSAGASTTPGPTPGATPSVNPDARPTGADKEYCDAVTEAQSELADTTAATDESVEQVVDALDEIARLAPADVREQWQLIGETVAEVRAVTRKAGVDLADLSDPQALAELTDAQKRALSEGLQKVDTSGLPQANQEIAAQVADLCGVALAPEAAVPAP